MRTTRTFDIIELFKLSPRTLPEIFDFYQLYVLSLFCLLLCGWISHFEAACSSGGLFV